MPPDPGPWGRVILHADMDAFYAAVEVRDRPELEGQPVVVGPDPREGHHRGVVLTASYEARRYGVRSAMPCAEALRRCPQAVFVPPDFAKYGRASEGIMATLRRFADRLEPSGIEEAFLDVTSRVHGGFGPAKDLARGLKAAVRGEHRLTCSVGIAPSKGVAKIASDFEKPDGLTVVPPDHVAGFLAPIPARKIAGVGPKTARRLEEIGIESIGDLQAFPRQDLVETFGAFGEYLQDVAFGRDADDVVELTGPPESIGTETTFEEDLDAYDVLWLEVEGMARDLHAQLLDEGFAYRTVTLKARYADFETHTRSRSLRVHTPDAEPILVLAQIMLKEVLASGHKLRLVGLRLSNLTDRKGPQATLARWEEVPRG